MVKRFIDRSPGGKVGARWAGRKDDTQDLRQSARKGEGERVGLLWAPALAGTGAEGACPLFLGKSQKGAPGGPIAARPVPDAASAADQSRGQAASASPLACVCGQWRMKWQGLALAAIRGPACPGVGRRRWQKVLKSLGSKRRKWGQARRASPRCCERRRRKWGQARRASPRRQSMLRRIVDLIENPAVGEVDFLGLGPAAGHFVDGEQFYFGELGGVFGGEFGDGGAVVVLGDDVLAFVAVQVLQVGFGDLAGAP